MIMRTNENLQRIADYLGSSGIIFPTTIRQVEAFEKLIAKEKKADFAFPTAEQIFESDYHTLKKEGKIIQLTALSSATEDFAKAAARNGKEIPKEILKRMRKDRDEQEQNR
jgi:hypothetical protein